MRAAFGLTAAVVLSAGPVAAEDSLHGLSPPIRKATLLVDGRIESPPAYNGGPVAPRPRRGETVEFQVFMPEAAGGTEFGCLLRFDDTGRGFTDYFEIQSATAWVLAFPKLTPGMAARPVLVQRDMETLSGTGSPGCSALFVDRPRVPPGGLVATFVLKARRDVPRNLPLRLTVSAIVISGIPPTRLWNLQAQRTIGWTP